MKKIAYCIGAHTDPEALKNLVCALDNEFVDFYIHIDKKVNSKVFLAKFNQKNVFFIPDSQRVKIHWGGYSQIMMEYVTIKTILKSGIRYNRVVNLSGFDYPLFSNEKILKTFLETEQEFIIGFDIENEVFDIGITPRKNRDKLLYYYQQDTNRYVAALFRRLKIKRRLSYKQSGYHFFFDGTFWGLSFDCLQDLIQSWENDAWLRKILKYALCPDEIWIHTLFFNSVHRSKGIIYPDNHYPGLPSLTPLHYIIYTDEIKVFTLSHLKELLASGKMFCRKVSSVKSEDLILKIDELRK